jgi:hypothetical protein
MLALNQDSVVPAVSTHRTFKPRIISAALLPNSHRPHPVERSFDSGYDSGWELNVHVPHDGSAHRRVDAQLPTGLFTRRTGALASIFTRYCTMSGRIAAFVVVVLAASWNVASLGGELPDRRLTPGTVNAAISEEQYRAQCHTKGWTRLYRPPIGFTSSLKKLQMKEYGYPLADRRDYEEDHLIPLCLAGAPQDPANLWPQPRFGEWSADHKDTLEAKLCRLVCDGRVPLAEAQREIATDWIAAYRKYIGRGSRKTAIQKVRSNP